MQWESGVGSLSGIWMGEKEWASKHPSVFSHALQLGTGLEIDGNFSGRVSGQIPGSKYISCETLSDCRPDIARMTDFSLM